MGELERAGLLDTTVPTVHARTLGEGIEAWDIVRSKDEAVHRFFMAAPGGVPGRGAPPVVPGGGHAPVLRRS